MAGIDWKQRFAKNTITAYVNAAAALVLGIILMRLLYTSWSRPEYGFWVLMWSSYGVGFAFDFGIGMTVKKAVSRHVAIPDLSVVNRLCTTAFWSFAVLGLILVLVALALRPVVFALLTFDPGYAGEFSRAYSWFALCFGILIPLGIFPEIPNGLQRIDLVNAVRLACALANFTAILLAIETGRSFSVVMLIAGICAVAPNLICALASFRLVPGLSLNPFRYFDFRSVRPQLSFSLSSYLTEVSFRILTASDRLIVAFLLGLPAVAVYQVAAKASQVLGSIGIQLSQIILPAAAHLSAREDHEGLRDLFLRTSRFNFIMLTPIYVLAAVYLEPVIQAITAEPAVDRETLIIGQLLLLAVYSSRLCGASANSILLMAGYEKTMLAVGVSRTSANIALSLALITPFGSPGVAAATLICATGFSWGLVLPKMLRIQSLSLRDFAAFHFRGSVPGLAVLALSIAALCLVFPLGRENLIVGLAWRGCAALVPTMLVNLKLVRSTWT